MKNVILLFCTVLLFNACKKAEVLNKEQYPVAYSGIKSIEEFDKIMNEINNNAANARLGNSAVTKINLSKEAIAELRSSIQFDKNGVMRGFSKMSIANNELTMEQYVYLMENLLNCSIIVFDNNNKIIASSSKETFKIRPHEAGTHMDWTWVASNCCRPHYDATCVTIGKGIMC